MSMQVQKYRYYYIIRTTILPFCSVSSAGFRLGGYRAGRFFTIQPTKGSAHGKGKYMFQTTEQALAVAYWMAEHKVGPRSSTAMAIDVLRERFDTSFVSKLPSGLSPHEWQAQSVMTIRFAQRLLADHPLELAVVQAEYAHGRDFVVAIAALRDWLRPHADSAEQRAALALLMRMFRRPPHSIREVERLTGLSKSTLHRWDQDWRAKVAGKLREAVARLDVPMSSAGIVVAH